MPATGNDTDWLVAVAVISSDTMSRTWRPTARRCGAPHMVYSGGRLLERVGASSTAWGILPRTAPVASTHPLLISAGVWPKHRSGADDRQPSAGPNGMKLRYSVHSRRRSESGLRLRALRETPSPAPETMPGFDLCRRIASRLWRSARPPRLDRGIQHGPGLWPGGGADDDQCRERIVIRVSAYVGRTSLQASSSPRTGPVRVPSDQPRLSCPGSAFRQRQIQHSSPSGGAVIVDLCRH
jgi:hypothetical protein